MSGTAPEDSEPVVVWLSDEEATRSELTGAKAAALASVSSDGLPVIPGFVIPVEIDPGPEHRCRRAGPPR